MMALTRRSFSYDNDVLQFWFVQAQRQRAAMTALAAYLS